MLYTYTYRILRIRINKTMIDDSSIESNERAIIKGPERCSIQTETKTKTSSEPELYDQPTLSPQTLTP